MHQAAGLPIPSLLSHVLLPLPRASVCVWGGGRREGAGVSGRDRERDRDRREKSSSGPNNLRASFDFFFFSRATSRLVKRLGPKERH